MAKVLPNGKLSGSIGGTTYATQPNGDVIAREKPTGAREKILYSPDCERSRENAIEFRRAIRGAMFVRHSLNTLIKGYELADSNLSGRVNSIVSKILKSDSTSHRGDRRIEKGQLDLLTSFAFRENKEQSFDRIFRASLQHTLDTATGRGTLQLLPCRLKRCLKTPKHTTHIRLVLQVASIQFEPEEYSTQYTTSPYLSLHESLQEPVSLQAAVELLPGGIVISAIGVVFYAKQTDGNYLELKGGVMKVLAAGKFGENPSDRKDSRHVPEEQSIGQHTAGEKDERPKKGGQAVACAAQTLLLPVRKTNRQPCFACIAPDWLTASIPHNEKTVDAVCDHVQEEADGNYARLAGKEQQHIHTDRVIAVQRMESNATPAGIKDRHCEQVIEVDEHGEQQDYVDPEPPRTVDQQGDEYREEKVQEIMYGLLHARQNYS